MGVSFRSDTTGGSVEIKLAPEAWSQPFVQWYAYAAIFGCAIVLSIGAVVAARVWKQRAETIVAPHDETNASNAAEHVEEKKTDIADDNASTATPDTSGNMEDLDGSSIADQQV